MNCNDVTINVQEMLERVEPPLSDECCIYRVPFDIRRLNEDAYTPKFVSIGPFHHNHHPHLQNMEKYKLTCCKEFLERTRTSSEDWVRYIEEVETHFRRCYSQTLELSKEELVKIIFVDSGFIFEHLLNFYERGIGSENDIFLLKPKPDFLIAVDLLMLENQLPFFVLEGLFNLSLTSASSSSSGGGNHTIPSLRILTVTYFSFLKKYNLPFEYYCNTSIRHFTDLARTFHLPDPQERGPRTGELVRYFPSATDLSEAGVRFKVNKELGNILDLKFSGGVLEIPHLEVDEVLTEVLLRNMVALEQFLYPFESYITDYAQVLDLLVNTSRDVDILVRHRILTHWLGNSDSVAKLFNGLLQNTVISNSSSNYLSICKDLNAFYKNPCNKLQSTLKRDYCSSPWQTAATIAAIVLLFLSLVQSVCSVLQVIQQ